MSLVFQTLAKTADVAVVSRPSGMAAAGAARAIDGTSQLTKRDGPLISTFFWLFVTFHVWLVQ